MKFAYELTDEDKDDFLRLISEGMKPNEAAKELGSTGTQFRKLRATDSPYYDALFARQYREAITSDEHRQAFLEKIREAVWDAARNGNTRLLEKLSLIYDPDWEPLRHANLNMNVQMIARVIPYLSNEEIEKAIASYEAEHIEQKADLQLLPPAS